jgi:hypothetical protein
MNRLIKLGALGLVIILAGCFGEEATKSSAKSIISCDLATFCWEADENDSDEQAIINLEKSCRDQNGTIAEKGCPNTKAKGSCGFTDNKLTGAIIWYSDALGTICDNQNAYLYGETPPPTSSSSNSGTSSGTSSGGTTGSNPVCYTDFGGVGFCIELSPSASAAEKSELQSSCEFEGGSYSIGSCPSNKILTCPDLVDPSLVTYYYGGIFAGETCESIDGDDPIDPIDPVDEFVASCIVDIDASNSYCWEIYTFTSTTSQFDELESDCATEGGIYSFSSCPFNYVVACSDDYYGAGWVNFYGGIYDGTTCDDLGYGEVPIDPIDPIDPIEPVVDYAPALVNMFYSENMPIGGTLTRSIEVDPGATYYLYWNDSENATGNTADVKWSAVGVPSGIVYAIGDSYLTDATIYISGLDFTVEIIFLPFHSTNPAGTFDWQLSDI